MSALGGNFCCLIGKGGPLKASRISSKCIENRGDNQIIKMIRLKQLEKFKYGLGDK